MFDLICGCKLELTQCMRSDRELFKAYNSNQTAAPTQASNLKNSDLHNLEGASLIDIDERFTKKIEYRTPKLDPSLEKSRQNNVF